MLDGSDSIRRGKAGSVGRSRGIIPDAMQGPGLNSEEVLE
jgi:hypothetical protein